jgi:hypothetical protein
MSIPETIQTEDPKIRTRLSTIQGVGLSIEHRLEAAKVELHRAQGVVAGLTAAAAAELPATMAEVGKLVTGEKFEPETLAELGSLAEGLDEERGKQIIAWLSRARRKIETAAKLNSRAVAKQEGVIEGLTKSVDECEILFKQEETKARQRENEADRGRRDEGGRPISLREQRGEVPVAEPVAKPTAKRPRKRAN